MFGKEKDQKTTYNNELAYVVIQVEVVVVVMLMWR